MKEAIRAYSMSDADLMMFTSNLVQSMTRDTTEFAGRGVTATNITDLETLGNAFEVFPTDESMLGLVKIQTQNKDTQRATATTKIQLISGFFEQKWGLKSGQYTRLGIKGLQNMTDNNFLRASRSVVAISTEYLADLTTEGLTQADIDSLETTAQAFEDGLNEVDKAIENRDLKTRERIAKGNELYSYVQKYCRIGKLIWENVDVAKYNDYVIKKSVSVGLSKPQNVQAELDGVDPNLINVTWNAVLDATEYDVYVNIAEIGAPAGDFNLLNTVTELILVAPAVPNQRNYFKIRAKNEEHVSDYSDEVFVDVPIS